MGSAPAIDMAVDIMAVDYVSSAILAISRGNDSLGRVFHLVSPHTTDLKQVCNWVAAAGYPVILKPYSVWRDDLDRVASHSNGALAPLAALFPRMAPEDSVQVPRTRVDCRNTLAQIEGSGIDCPKATIDLIKIYLNYLSAAGLIKKPTTLRT